MENYTPEEWRRFIRIVEHGPNGIWGFLNSFFNVPPPSNQTVYHYTNHDSLINIFTSNSLWASKVDLLNDADEIRFGITGFKTRLVEHRNMLSQLYEESGKKNGSAFLLSFGLDYTDSQYTPPEQFNIFSVSFCSEPDISSAWLSYGNRGEGYAIGLSSAVLTSCDSSNICKFGAVVYGQDKLNEMLDGVINIAAQQYQERLKDPRLHKLACIEWLSHEVNLGVVPTLAFFKKNNWRDEREWRLLVKDGEIKFRPDNDKPYMEFTVKSDKDTQPFIYLPIVEVVVGSQISDEQLREAKAVAIKCGYSDVVFKRSDTVIIT